MSKLTLTLSTVDLLLYSIRFAMGLVAKQCPFLSVRICVFVYSALVCAGSCASLSLLHVSPSFYNLQI